MKYLALVVALVSVALGLTAPASAKTPEQANVYISKDRSSLTVTPFLPPFPEQPTIIPAKRGERWYHIGGKIKGKTFGGFVEYYTTPSGNPMVADLPTFLPDTSSMIADITGQGTAGMRYDNTTGGLEVAIVAGSITITGMTFDGSGNLNVNVQVFGATVKINPVPSLQTYGTNTVLISQMDFAVNQATCTAVSNPAAYAGGVPNTGHFCWIIKNTAGTLFRLTWDSLSNMNTLVAGTTVQLFDSATTNSGSIVYQGSFGAGQIIDFGQYGRPFVNGLVIIANHSFGVAANDSMEAWIK